VTTATLSGTLRAYVQESCVCTGVLRGAGCEGNSELVSWCLSGRLRIRNTAGPQVFLGRKRGRRDLKVRHQDLGGSVSGAVLRIGAVLA
jgi:hypothetical protein